MLAVPADRLPDAIGDLDPGNRALLDLSLRRGVSDAEIGELLRKQPSDVARGRDAVLELLADALDVNGHDRRERVQEAVAGLPDDAWQVRAPAPPPAPSDRRVAELEPAEPEEPGGDEGEGEGEVFDSPVRFEPEERRSRRGGLLALLGLLAVAVALIVVLSSGGDDDDDSGTSQGNGSQPAQNGGPQPKGNSQNLTPLGNGKGGGTVTVTDEGATIVIRSLSKPVGNYQVWLYNDIVDAQSLGTISAGSGKLEVRLPPEAGDYKFVDVSNEPSDANPNHSGASVLRAPLGELLNN
jgi:hypothetical protein